MGIGAFFAWVWRNWWACLLVGAISLLLSFAAVAALASEIGNIFHDPCAGGSVPNCDGPNGALELLYLLLALGLLGLAGTLFVRGLVLLVRAFLRWVPGGRQRALVGLGVATLLAVGGYALYSSFQDPPYVRREDQALQALRERLSLDKQIYVVRSSEVREIYVDPGEFHAPEDETNYYVDQVRVSELMLFEGHNTGVQISVITVYGDHETRLFEEEPAPLLAVTHPAEGVRVEVRGEIGEDYDPEFVKRALPGRIEPYVEYVPPRDFG